MEIMNFDLMEIFTLVTGVIYIVLEIRQKNLMWIVGVATSLAAMWVFFRQGLYASFGLNTYYLITSFIGLWHWGRDKQKLGSAGTAKSKSGRAKKKEAAKPVVHLNKMSWFTLVVSLVFMIAGTFGLAQVMELLEDPMSYLDSAVTVMSIVATWWLVRAYIHQWWLWVVADALSTALCVHQGMWPMAALYAAYTASAVIGYFYWKKNGQYIK
jgi:nicotinamide mononucleotide transporter